MKHFNFPALLLTAAVGLLAWGLYDYFSSQPVNHENCGVTVVPQEGSVTIPAFNRSNRVPLRLVNRSGRPVRIVGNNAC